MINCFDDGRYANAGPALRIGTSIVSIEAGTMPDNSNEDRIWNDMINPQRQGERKFHEVTI
jgi:hypothetical protein